MTQREIKQIFPTMKIEAKEGDLAFQVIDAIIGDVKDIETKFGSKIVCVLNNEKIGDFQVFLNNYSMEKLITAYGKDDSYFIGKIVSLSKEKDRNFDKNMIVLTPKSK